MNDIYQPRFEDFEEEALSERLEALLRTHRQFIEQFAMSLENAYHFLKMAHLAMENEPGETQQLLGEVMQVDLPGNLRRLREDFQWLLGFCSALPAKDDDGQALRLRVQELDELYQKLEEEALEQAEEVNELMARLST